MADFFQESNLWGLKGNRNEDDLHELFTYGNLGVNTTKKVKILMRKHIGYSILTKVFLKCLELSEEFSQLDVLFKKEKNKICVFFLVENNKQIGASSFNRPDFTLNGLRLVFTKNTMYLPWEVDTFTQKQY
nr:hypothetical protein [uncultured Allomuricauda sp.]